MPYLDAVLYLEDGRAFPGRRFGARLDAGGEVVFNTSMTGYPEILTDPSYAGQIVCMTSPHQGNYGITPEDLESRRPFLRGFLVRENSPIVSNFRASASLENFLAENGVVALEEIDTRALTRHLRSRGALRGVIADSDTPERELQARVSGVPAMETLDLVGDATIQGQEPWTEGANTPFSYRFPGASGFDAGRSGAESAPAGSPVLREPPKPRVVAVDFGIKHNILRSLVECGFRVTRVGAGISPRQLRDLKPDGVFLSNGPGDPAVLTRERALVETALEIAPTFGICLGHQLMALAMGAKTFKLKFGHHGANHPVMDLSTRKVEITAQNHNYAVDPGTLPDELEVTHLNLNDRTVEGIRHRGKPCFSVQYHPEAAPGPHDSMYLFARFAEKMARHAADG